MKRESNGGASNLGAWCAACVGLLMLVASLALLVFEARPYFTSGLRLDQKIAAISSGQLEPGLSFNSQTLVLDDCRQVLASVRVRVMAGADKAPLVNHCAAVSRAVAERSPLNSYARYVEALAAASSGQTGELGEYLLASQRTAPWEAWLAGLRVELAARYFDLLPDVAQAAYRSDLTAAASSNQSLPAVLDAYRRYVPQREMITVAVERLPAPMQSAFVSQLRSTSQVSP
ncbi:hypothetical protein [Devosia sp.]|uniref:hypothetical protein n=1 Tax=Devosia sp. TaxID=1871048 RepID=UPI003F6F0175